MSRKSNRYKAKAFQCLDELQRWIRLCRELSKKVAVAEAEAAKAKAAAERHASLSIILDDVRHSFLTDRYAIKIAFSPAEFEYQFFRGGRPNVSRFAEEMGREAGRKVARVIEDYIAKSPAH